VKLGFLLNDKENKVRIHAKTAAVLLDQLINCQVSRRPAMLFPLFSGEIWILYLNTGDSFTGQKFRKFSTVVPGAILNLPDFVDPEPRTVI